MSARNVTQIMHNKLVEFQEQLIHFHYQLSPEVKEGEIDLSELTDVGYLHREMEKTLEELLRDVRAQKNFLSRILAIKITKRVLRDPTLKLQSKGQLAKAFPDAKVVPKLPRKDDPKYSVLLKALGVEEDSITRQLVMVYWPKFCEYITELTAEGKPLPEGIISSKVEPQVQFRRLGHKQRKTG